MYNTISITLDKADVLQTLDVLYERAEAWEKTESFLSGSADFGDDFFIIEECDNPAAAAEIAKHFRDIISRIEKQMVEHRASPVDLLNK